MAKLTREQALKWSKQCGNGFIFDARHYLMFNEKQCVREDIISDTVRVRTTIMFMPEFEIKMSGSCSYKRETGKYIPCVHVATYHCRPDSDFMSSSGLGHFFKAGDAIERQTYKTLAELSKKIDINKYIAVGKGEPISDELKKNIY